MELLINWVIDQVIHKTQKIEICDSKKHRKAAKSEGKTAQVEGQVL